MQECQVCVIQEKVPLCQDDALGLEAWPFNLSKMDPSGLLIGLVRDLIRSYDNFVIVSIRVANPRIGTDPGGVNSRSRDPKTYWMPEWFILGYFC